MPVEIGITNKSKPVTDFITEVGVVAKYNKRINFSIIADTTLNFLYQFSLTIIVIEEGYRFLKIVTRGIETVHVISFLF